MSELDNILNDDAAAPAAPPIAGRSRTAVGGGGSSVSLQVNDSFEAIYNGFSMVTGKFGDSKLFKFTLIAPTTLTVVSKDADTGVKSEDRKALDVGSSISTFGKGNFGYLLGSVVEGMDIEVKRVEDGVLPKSHKFAGTAVHTYEVAA
jgi:hypothetical protein